MGRLGVNKFDRNKIRSKGLLFFILAVYLLLPSQSFASSGIATAVANACAPEPTVPDVGSCSSCHSTTNNRGPNDLTAAGQWALSPSTYNLFCPAATTPPPTAPPPVTPPPTTPPPGSPSPTPSPGMGMGSGGGSSVSDDDDDEHESDDDDGGSGASSSLRSRLRALRSRLRSLSTN